MITLNPTNHTTIELELGDEYIHSGYIAWIKHDYGEYQFDGETRRNVGEETLYINSYNKAYAKRRALEYWRRHF